MNEQGENGGSEREENEGSSTGTFATLGRAKDGKFHFCNSMILSNLGSEISEWHKRKQVEEFNIRDK